MNHSTHTLFDAEHWQDRAQKAFEVAEEAETIAEGMHDPDARRIMFGIAEDYKARAMHARSMEHVARQRGAGAIDSSG